MIEPKADSPKNPEKVSALELEPVEGATEPAQEDLGLELATHNRYSYSAITQRDDYSWPGSKRLAVYFAINLEHFEFGKGMGAKLGGQCARLVHCASGNDRRFLGPQLLLLTSSMLLLACRV